MEEWKKEDDKILKQWVDKAKCYTLMHMSSYRKYKSRNSMFTIPVIIISTLTGSANFAQITFQNYEHITSVVIGTLNIIVGIITTIYHFLKIAEQSESHKSAASGWGKFYEFVNLEFSKHFVDRESPIKIIKYCAEQYEHLIDSSPVIPEEIISKFRDSHKDMTFPNVCSARVVI